MNIKSTAIFDFLLKNFQKLIKFITQSYLSLLNSFLFLSRFSVSLKSLDNYFFRWFAYKFLFSRFSVLISYNMWSSNHFSISNCFPCFPGPRFFRVQVFQARVQGPGPGFRSSQDIKLYQKRLLITSVGRRLPCQKNYILNIIKVLRESFLCMGFLYSQAHFSPSDLIAALIISQRRSTIAIVCRLGYIGLNYLYFVHYRYR